jgi:hypothetical protein
MPQLMDRVAERAICLKQASPLAELFPLVVDGSIREARQQFFASKAPIQTE